MDKLSTYAIPMFDPVAVPRQITPTEAAARQLTDITGLGREWMRVAITRTGTWIVRAWPTDRDNGWILDELDAVEAAFSDDQAVVDQMTAARARLMHDMDADTGRLPIPVP